MAGDWLSSYLCWILFSTVRKLVSLSHHTLKLCIVHFEIKNLTACNQIQ
jgi:hypothetical protein